MQTGQPECNAQSQLMRCSAVRRGTVINRGVEQPGWARYVRDAKFYERFRPRQYSKNMAWRGRLKVALTIKRLFLRMSFRRCCGCVRTAGIVE